MNLPLNTILKGDSAEVLKTIPDNSIDSIVCDPPYAISFMQKSWDRALPSLEIWQECLRVLKPGAFAFVMSAPRSDVCSRMSLRLEEAGFKIDFTPIYWTYASGFPKAMNIGKAVDKRNGRTQEEYKALGEFLKKKITDSDFVCANKVGYSSALVRFWRLGERVPNKETYLKLKELYALDNSFDELIEREEAEREVIGKGKSGKTAIWQEGGMGDFDITKSVTPQAKALDGSYGGFQPKPAVEVIIVAMKPLSEKTYVDQAMRNGKGITWLDDCRIPTDKETGWNGLANGQFEHSGSGKHQPEYAGAGEPRPITGRFPANLLVSDDVLNDGRVQKSGKAVRKNIGISQKGDRYGGFTGAMASEITQDLGYGDSGSYSRYFDLDAWAKTLPFLIVPKASKSEKNRGLEGMPEKSKPVMGEFGENPGRDTPKSSPTPRANFHPTVKPLKLMSYLITLGSREGDTILDPFAGSCTTLVAAQELKRNYIGVEREEEYVKICEARLAVKQPTLI